MHDLGDRANNWRDAVTYEHDELIGSCLLEDQSGLGDQATPLKEERATAVQDAYRAVAVAQAEHDDIEDVQAGRMEAVSRPQIDQFIQARSVSERRRRPSDIVQILMHTPEGGESGTLSVLQGTRASFDFFLPPSGKLYRCNDFWNFISWQAGDWPVNQRSVGIEQWDRASNMGAAPLSHYQELAQLVAWLIQETGTPHRYTVDKSEPGIIDHRNVTPGRRTDPGEAFRRELLMDLVGDLLRAPDPVPTPAPARPQVIWDTGAFVARPDFVARKGPSRSFPVFQELVWGRLYSFDGYTDQGEMVGNSRRWFHLNAASGYGWVHSSGAAAVTGLGV